VLPEVLLGVAAHPALERRGVRGDDAVDVALAVAGDRVLDALGVQREAAVGRRMARAETDRRAQAQGEHGRPARRLRRPAEERHPRAREPRRPLVDDHGHRAASRSARGVRRTASPSHTTRMPSRSRVRVRKRSNSGFSCCRATTSSGTPRAAT
jgi:hypothetical protein